MKTNSIFIVISFFVWAGCQGNGIKDKSEEAGKAKWAVDERAVSAPQEETGKGVADEHFVPETMRTKNLLAKSKETLPYDKQIDISTVKYHLIDSKFLKGASEFLCGEGEQLRYLPLPNKGDIALILVPMDCGDFEYRFYLLTIKNQTVVSKLYVEGFWYEPNVPDTEEMASFEIDKNFSIKVKTSSLGSPQQVRHFIIEDDGQIIEEPEK